MALEGVLISLGLNGLMFVSLRRGGFNVRDLRQVNMGLLGKWMW